MSFSGYFRPNYCSDANRSSHSGFRCIRHHFKSIAYLRFDRHDIASENIDLVGNITPPFGRMGNCPCANRLNDISDELKYPPGLPSRPKGGAR